MRWSRLTLGFILAIMGGVTLGSAFHGGAGTLWATGTLTLLLAVLSTLWAIRRGPRPQYGDADSPDWNAAAAPPLGEMLVNYGLLSEADLDRALKQQKQTKKRLGQVLVKMGLVTYAQVAEVLEEQLSRREGRLLWGSGQRLVT